ncbi:hypothetical protein HELRODRAFT_75171 [Helobdella robusta]|uniref:Uncharacterized protein n=1 Tax=Helobdella robusta TaxID=6412 RepID=T1G220_HELRO|nr:hypothetical protein HELRODRAFT_75171 [Helobdella robusta]ESO08241.1 hypothetical protein HELRODRAFT_75171 [Helobdella robusta]
MFKAVLIIPDSYKRSNVKELVDMMMNKMGFSQMFVVQESVCCSFGDGSQTCCVVDVGHCKTSVCCIEDGLIKKNTLFTARLGGSDVTKCYLWLLNKYGLTNKNVNLVENSRRCSLFIQHLKERYCHLMDVNIFDCFVLNENLINYKRQLNLSAMFKFHMSDERMLTPLCLFFPDMLGLKATPGIHKSMIFGVEKSVSDASDYLDDEYIQQTTTKHEQAARLRKKEVYENHTNTLLQDAICPDETMASNDYEALDQPDSALKGNKNDDDIDWLNVYESTLVGLHQLAIKSIDSCESEDTKQKMFSNILLTGGGSKFMGIHLYFEYLLSCHMQSIKNRNVYDINIKIKDDDQGIRGACIMSCLDTVQELWFDKYQWCKYSVRILREKCPFVW